MLRKLRVYMVVPLIWVGTQQSVFGAALSAGEIVEKYPGRVEFLFEALDLQLPVMQLVAESYETGDDAEALRRLLVYYRAKYVHPEWIPDAIPPRKDILELAEDATQGIFTIQSQTYRQPRREDGSIDWDDLGPKNDKEWAWMLNRHHHFNFLLTAYRHTGDDRYMGAINQQLVEWIPTHPAPDRLTFSTAWRPLEAARRILDSWLSVYAVGKTTLALSDEALFLLLSSIPEHASTLIDHYSFWGGNHLVTEKTAVVTCAVIWSEFKESERWLSAALEMIEKQLLSQTYPDGSYKELANHYQKIIGESFLRLKKLEYYSGRDLLSPTFAERAESIWNYFAYVSRPSGYGPLNNDSSLEDNFFFLEEAMDVYERDDWKHILNSGENGVIPDGFPSRYFEWAGHAVMREGWEKDDQWAFFDMGPNGSAHQHFDRLHLSVSMGEADLLVDSGRYIYKPGPNRNYFRGGVGHNVIRVDGKDSVRPPNVVNQPMANRAETTKDWDLFSAEVFFDGKGPFNRKVNHERTVVYFRGVGWLVIDDLLGFGPFAADVHWNFHPDCVVRQSGNGLEATMGNGSLAELALLSSNKGSWDLVRGQYTPEMRGWYSWAYNTKLPSTSARFRSKGVGPRRFVWWVGEKDQSLGAAAEISDLEGLSKNMDDFIIEAGSKKFRVSLRENGWEVSSAG